MIAPPIPCVFRDGAFHPLPSFHNVAAAHYGAGEIVPLVRHEERSEVSHRHEFAWLREAWQSLPDHLAQEYPTSERLRKTALIRTGWCTVQDYPCGSHAEALRWIVNLRRELDEYSIVEVSASVVRVFRARSQARGAMNAADFQASKTSVLEWISGLLGVEPDTLTRQRESA